MATPLGMFDREGFVKIIDRDCFGERGTSAVVVGPHKVGKTHLLKHIASRKHKGYETLFCNIDLYLLGASLEDGETLSDHVFLGFFLSKLADQIDEWVETQNDEKEQWNADIVKSEQALAAIEKLPADNPLVVDLLPSYREQHLTAVTVVKQKNPRIGDTGKNTR